MNKYLLVALAMTIFSCGGNKKTEEDTKEKEVVSDCWIGAEQADCNLAKSYEEAKRLAVEFKTKQVYTDFGLEKAYQYNDSILNLIKPLEQDLVKIKELIGEDDYNLYFSSIEEQKEKNALDKKKIDVISNLVLTPTLEKFDAKYGTRYIAYTIENNSDSKIELIAFVSTFFDKDGNQIFIEEQGGLGASGFVPNTGGDFFPENYKGSGRSPIIATDYKTETISTIDETILKKMASVKQKIVNVDLK